VRIVQPERLLARYVQGERKRRGWSQRDLAERLGEVGRDIHATGITRLERGERAIRFDEFVALCRAFDKTVVEVFSALAMTAEVGGRVVEGRATGTFEFAAAAAGEAAGTAFDAIVLTDTLGLTDAVTQDITPEPVTVEVTPATLDVHGATHRHTASSPALDVAETVERIVAVAHDMIEETLAAYRKDAGDGVDQ
jgi:transcriptional regulator with XRE-family HTH domain